MEKVEPSDVAGGDVKCSAVVENSLAVPQKVKHRMIHVYDHMTLRSRNSTPMYIPKRRKTGTRRRTRTRKFTAALFTVAERWKQPKCLTRDEERHTLWHLHTVEYYSAVKGNEVLTCATMWTNLRNVIVSERSKIQKVTQ